MRPLAGSSERPGSTRPKPRARLGRRIRARGHAWPGATGSTTPEPVASCELTVAVRRADGTSVSALVVRLDVADAEIIAPHLAVRLGEEVWIVLELGIGRAYTVALTCNVSAVDQDRIGLSFVGLPEEHRGARCRARVGAQWERFESEAVAV